MNPPHHHCRLRLPERNQVEIRFLALDQLLPDDHPARLAWAYVEGLDLPPFYQTIQARQGVAGRDANDPRILMALWLYAHLDGVGSARRLDQLCQESRPYQWLAGGVSMNYHSLADFRVEHVERLDQLLTDSVARLLHQGLVPTR
jgi:transposase